MWGEGPRVFRRRAAWCVSIAHDEDFSFQDCIPPEENTRERVPTFGERDDFHGDKDNAFDPSRLLLHFFIG